MIKRLIAAALALAAGAGALQAQTVEASRGGWFTKIVDPDEGELAREGQVVVIFDGQGQAWFKANLGRADGRTAILSSDGWIPAEGNKFRFNVLTDDLDYTLEGEMTSDDTVVLTDRFNAGGSPFGMGMTLGGTYEREGSYVADVNGFLYHYVAEATELELCAGGYYSGTVRLPEAVNVRDEALPVAGFDTKCFYGNREVTDAWFDPDTQYARPAAFYGSGIHYAWDYRGSLPAYAYPGDGFFTFVRPTVPEGHDFSRDRWLLFKQNYDFLHFVKDRSQDEEALWGYSPWRAEQMQGAYYELRVPDVVRSQMFRGYEPQEVIALVADSWFVAQHRFPSFSRWKYPEPEVAMGEAFDRQMEQRYGRKVKQSRYIGNLREEDGRLGICEFEVKDGEAMVVIAWTVGGQVKATWVDTTEVDPEYGEQSVWNVDDGGDYGIPDLLCVAMDPRNNVILWLNHPAPESMNIFGLRQQGDQLVLFGEDQWYVRVD